MRHTIVSSSDRDDFRGRAGRARAHYSGARCQYWLFEEAGLSGAYVEFFEGPDPDTLLHAHRTAPEPIVDSARMYLEVELS